MLINRDINSRTRVKICGLRSLEHARFAAGAYADFVGFIFYKESLRYISPDEAGAIITWLEGSKSVGVFVEQNIDDINDIALISGVDYVQLHGPFNPDSCALIERPIIRAISVNAHSDLGKVQQEIDSFEDYASYFLFDTAHKDLHGGTGEVFNWQILNQISLSKPFFLAGGINQENAASAISQVHPYALDVSSSLESTPGKKDFEKMSDFFDAMNQIWKGQNDD